VIAETGASAVVPASGKLFLKTASGSIKTHLLNMGLLNRYRVG
jgi:hypothetical protein